MNTIVPDDGRLEALAEFAAGAGHEINNPVATITARVQLLLKDETDPQRRHWLSIIGGQADRIREMIGDTMLLGRPPQPRPELLELPGIIRSVLDQLTERAVQRGCTFDACVQQDVVVWADRVQLCVVISSLIGNSLNAVGGGGLIEIAARTITAGENRAMAVFSVTDHGPGLSEMDRRHLFDPFYSGRQAGRGLGFGLPKCWRIVSNHRGRIEVDSVPGEATTFTVFWPSTPPVDDDLSARSPKNQ